MPTSEANPPETNPPDSNQEQWRGLHPTMLLFGLGGIIRSTLLPLLLGGYAAFKGNLFLFFLVAFGIALSGIGLLMRFFGFRYQVGGGHITIREGIFSKKMRSIPVKRIHNINTSQGPLGRLFKVVRLDIETAGGGAAEASFVALSFADAQWIQDQVRFEKEKDGGPLRGENGAGGVAAREIFSIRIRDILVAGATTNRMGVIAVALALVFQYAEETVLDLIPDWLADGFQWLGIMSHEQPLYILVMGLLMFAVFFFVAWIISILTALIRWHRFTIQQKGSDLRITTGLFTLRAFTIPLSKVQALQCGASPIRRLLGVVQIKVRSAGHVGLQDQRRAESDLLVPIAEKGRIDFFVKAVWPDAEWERVRWLAVHPYTRTRQFRIMVFLLAILFALLHAWLGIFPLNGLLLPLVGGVGVAAAWLISHLTYKQTAYAQDREFIYTKTGFLGLHFWVIPIGRIQNLNLTQTPFQRLRNLASLHIDVAGTASGREAVIPNIPLPDAYWLFNRLGHPRKRGAVPRLGATGELAAG